MDCMGIFLISPNILTHTKHTMFTLEQINEIHDRLGRTESLAQYPFVSDDVISVTGHNLEHWPLRPQWGFSQLLGLPDNRKEAAVKAGLKFALTASGGGG